MTGPLGLPEAPVRVDDSTGIKVHKAGGWIERVHGKKRRYMKLRFVARAVWRREVEEYLASFNKRPIVGEPVLR